MSSERRYANPGLSLNWKTTLTMDIPSFIEDHISQIPALKLLMNLGYTYITPVEALEMRGNRSSNVLLEAVLKEQLPKINSIQYKGKEVPFSESNIS